MRRQRFDYTFWIATQPDKSDAVLIPADGYPLTEVMDLYVFMKAGEGQRVFEVVYSINLEFINIAKAPPWDLLPDGAAWRPELVAQDIAVTIREAH